MTRDFRFRRKAVISHGQISLVLGDEEEALRIAQAIADITDKRVILTNAGGVELGTFKGRGRLSRTDQARQVAEEYGSDQRKILKKLREKLARAH
jgi:type II secretory pathway component PulC